MIGAMIVKAKVRGSFDVISHDLDKFMANWADDATLIYPKPKYLTRVFKGVSPSSLILLLSPFPFQGEGD